MDDRVARGRAGFSTRYEQFLTLLRDQIRSGALVPSALLPSEPELSVQSALSRSSVRKALEVLVAEGLVVKVRGKGNFVATGVPPLQQPLTVGVLHPALELLRILSLLETFAKANAGIDVKPLRFGVFSYVETIRDLLRHESVPDCFLVTDSLFADFSPEQELLDLTPLMPPELDIDAHSYREVFEAFSHKGRIYAVPIVWSPVVLCYNRDLFDRAGVPYPDSTWDWQRLVDAARRLTVDLDGDGSPDQWGFCISTDPNRWPVFLMQHGARLQDPSGTGCDFTDPRIAEAIDQVLALIYQHRVSPFFSNQMDIAAEDLFARGKAAMVLTTYFYLNTYSRLRFRWDIAEPPRGRERATGLITLGLSVNKRTKRLDVVRRLIEFFLSKQAQWYFKREGATLPVLREVAESSEGLDESIHPASYGVFKDVLPYARRFTSLGRRPCLLQLNRELGLAWHNLESPDDAVARLIRGGNRGGQGGLR